MQRGEKESQQEQLSVCPRYTNLELHILYHQYWELFTYENNKHHY